MALTSTRTPLPSTLALCWHSTTVPRLLTQFFSLIKEELRRKLCPNGLEQMFIFVELKPSKPNPGWKEGEPKRPKVFLNHFEEITEVFGIMIPRFWTWGGGGISSTKLLHSFDDAGIRLKSKGLHALPQPSRGLSLASATPPVFRF